MLKTTDFMYVLLLENKINIDLFFRQTFEMEEVHERI